MDKIFIKDLVAHGIIGVNEWERKVHRVIVINLVLFTDLKKAGKSDDLRDTVDYSLVAKKVMKYVEESQHFMVEALAEELAGLCLQEPRIMKVLVRVDKPAAVRDCRSVGVEIERDREG